MAPTPTPAGTDGGVVGPIDVPNVQKPPPSPTDEPNVQKPPPGGGTDGGSDSDAGTVDPRNIPGVFPSSSDASTPEASTACYSRGGFPRSAWFGPALAHQNVCTPEQISGLYEACYGINSTQARCDFFTEQASTFDCQRCIRGWAFYDQGRDVIPLPQPAIVDEFVLGHHRSAPNVTACGAALLGLPNCGKAATDLHSCEVNSCALCSPADREACNQDARNIECASIVSLNRTSCIDPIAAGQPTWADPCGQNAANFEAAFAAVSQTMCGE